MTLYSIIKQVVYFQSFDLHFLHFPILLMEFIFINQCFLIPQFPIVFDYLLGLLGLSSLLFHLQSYLFHTLHMMESIPIHLQSLVFLDLIYQDQCQNLFQKLILTLINDVIISHQVFSFLEIITNSYSLLTILLSFLMIQEFQHYQVRYLSIHYYRYILRI